MMNRWTVRLRALGVVLGLSLLAGGAPAAPTLQPYASEAELRDALTRWRTAAEALRPSSSRERATGDMAKMASPMAMSAAPAPAAAAAPAGESITNVQTAGVDEGGIVKRAGDFLVILRRGRLFTVRVGGDRLQPVHQGPAYGPGIDPRGAWYDELLVAGRSVVVVGYSYVRGGTEIGLFDLGDDGRLTYRSTHHLRSQDYFSARNYASRLVGTRLVFYTPFRISPWQAAPWETPPGLRRWQGDASASAPFERLLPATRIYRTDDEFDPGEALALHTVTTCELAAAPLRCESTAVLGPVGRVSYVSAGSVYVWTTTPGRRGTTGAAASALFRLPLDPAAGAPTALKTVGVPIDQLSFLEGEDGYLNVLLRPQGAAEGWPWTGGLPLPAPSQPLMPGSAPAPSGPPARATAASLALLRVPLSALGDGRTAAGPAHYRTLPPFAGAVTQNRYVGDWLLWGGQGEQALALRHADPKAEAVTLRPGHRVERIEALGRHALLVGAAGGDLQFTAVRLGRTTAELAGQHRQQDARQGETRTHGFFYRPDPAAGSEADAGWLGLPVTQGDGAAVLFLRQRELVFAPLGTLQARPPQGRDDRCLASCVDWYGNARPIFLGERVLALMGYELVEGRLGRDGREPLVERRRVDFGPRLVPSAGDGRHSPFD